MSRLGRWPTSARVSCQCGSPSNPNRSHGTDHCFLLNTPEEAARTARAATTALADRLRSIHQWSEQEAESWYGDEGDHDQRFPECPSLTGTGECEGHTFTIKVCDECGYMSTTDYEVAYRPWPCPTVRLLDEFSPLRGPHAR